MSKYIDLIYYQWHRSEICNEIQFKICEI